MNVNMAKATRYAFKEAHERITPAINISLNFPTLPLIHLALIAFRRKFLMQFLSLIFNISIFVGRKFVNFPHFRVSSALLKKMNFSVKIRKCLS